jgi:hypothetical protein
MITGNDITQAFRNLGGMKRLVAWAKDSDDNLGKFYSMFGRTLLQADDVQHVEENPEVMRANLVGALMRSAAAQYIDRGVTTIDGEVIDDGKPLSGICPPEIMNYGVPDDVVAAAAAHAAARGITDTGMEVTLAPQALPEQPKPSDGISKPVRPDVSHVAKRDKPKHTETVVGLYGSLCNGNAYPTSPDDPYGNNFSQNPASRFGS